MARPAFVNWSTASTDYMDSEAGAGDVRQMHATSLRGLAKSSTFSCPAGWGTGSVCSEIRPPDVASPPSPFRDRSKNATSGCIACARPLTDDMSNRPVKEKNSNRLFSTADHMRNQSEHTPDARLKGNE